MATTKMSPKQIAFTFFLANAGFSYDPKTETPAKGRARCARQLAKAERDAAALGFTFEWDYDQEGCIGCSCDSPDCKCSTGEDHECLSCLCRNADGEVVASLSSICEPSREYRRVVEAELAEEALQSHIYTSRFDDPAYLKQTRNVARSERAIRRAV